MSYRGRDRRKPVGDEPRRAFGDLAALAIRRRIRETGSDGAFWEHTPNLAWARWCAEDGRFAFCGLRRNVDFLTAELGVSPVEVHLEDLPLVEAIAMAMPTGCRIRLGHMLQGHDRWWSSGGSEPSLLWRLDWLAHQAHLRLRPFLDAAAPPP